MAFSVVANGFVTGSVATGVATFTSVPFGAAATGRIVTVHGSMNWTVGPTTAAVTIGGVSATNVGVVVNQSGIASIMAHAVVPTGTSGTVVVTTDGTLSASPAPECGSWSIYDGAYTDGASNIGAASTSAISVSCNVANGGVQIAGVRWGSAQATTWTNATESFESASQRSSSAEFSPGAGASHSVSATPAASASRSIWTSSWASSGYILTADAGSFTETGQTANLLYGRAVAGAAGSFALTGQTANLLFGRKVAANQGAFVLTGQDATLTYTPLDVLLADAGAFVLTGQNAGLVRGLRLTADAAAFLLTGQAAGLYRGYPLTASAGSFALSGQAASLLRTRLVTGAAGTFVLTGQAAALARGYGFPVDAGQFVLTGYPANLVVNRILRLPQKFVRLLPDNRWVSRDVNLMGTDRLALFGVYGEVDKLGFDASQWLDGALLSSARLDFGTWPVTAESNSTIALLTVPHAGERRIGSLELRANDGRKRTIEIELAPL